MVALVQNQPTTDPEPSPEARARAEVSRWIRAQIKTRPHWRAPQMATECVAFIASRPDLAVAYAPKLRPVLYDQILDVFGETRRPLKPTPIAKGVDLTAPTKGAGKTLLRWQRDWTNWKEHAGDRHMYLMDMTREDLLMAASERRQAGLHQIAIARVWDRLAEKVPAGKVVREAFADERAAGDQIDRWFIEARDTTGKRQGRK